MNTVLIEKVLFQFDIPDEHRATHAVSIRLSCFYLFSCSTLTSNKQFDPLNT